MADVDVQRVCRTCLAEEAAMKPLWGPETQQSCLTGMISSLTELEPIEGDGLPIKICYKCFESVTNAFLFKLQAEKADAKLRLFIAAKSLPIKQETPDHLSNLKIEDKGVNFRLNSLNSEDDCMQSDLDNNQFDDSDIKPLKDLNIISNIDKITNESVGVNKKKDRRTLVCKLCDKTFKYINCLKKHLQNHISYEPFATVNTKSKAYFLKIHEQLAGHNPEKLTDDYIIKSMIEDIKNEKFDNYIGEVFSSDNSIEEKKGKPILTNSIKTLTTIKKKKIINLKSKIKHGIKRIRKHRYHKCAICQRMFSRSNHLIRHMSTHDYNYPDKCEICNKVFPNKEMLLKHNKVQCERIDKPYRCITCDLMFSNLATFTEHMSKRHNGESVSANFIPIDDIIADKLDQYMTEINVDIINSNSENLKTKMYSCGGCDMRFENKTDFNDHEINFHDGESVGLNFINLQDIKMEKVDALDENMEVNNEIAPVTRNGEKSENQPTITQQIKKVVKRVRKDKFYQCSLCSRLFSRSNHLIRHMSTHNYEYPDKCQICNKVFPNKEMLQKHSFIRCEKTPKVYKCDNCDIKFETEALFNEHVKKRHVGEFILVNIVDPACHIREKYVCDHCDKKFYRKDHLEKHMKFHLKKDKPYQCQVCLRKFKDADNLISHSMVHQLKKGLDSRYHCTYCKSSFSNTSNLVVHMRRHTGEKPFKCDICSKGFPRSSDLRCHRRTHTGEKPCLCNICGKGFSRSNKLVRHMRVHTGQRPYKCTYCDRAFTQSNDLTLHTRRHTGDRPYICDVCGERFINGTALHAHRKIQAHFSSVADLASNILPECILEETENEDLTVKHED